MQHTTTVLKDEHGIAKQVLVLALSQTVVFALERVDGVLVGTHAFVSKDKAPRILSNLASVFHVG